MLSERISNQTRVNNQAVFQEESSDKQPSKQEWRKEAMREGRVMYVRIAASAGDVNV